VSSGETLTLKQNSCQGIPDTLPKVPGYAPLA
jgi:hypothetical protein